MRKLSVKVENGMRKLRRLGVDSDNYGKLQVPVFQSDVHTLFAGKFSGEVWDLNEMLEIGVN